MQVDGIARPNPNRETKHATFTVRTKDIHRILGEHNSMLMNISQVSGASISISVDMRNLLNHNAHVEVWGLVADVDLAEETITDLIKEVYDAPPSCLALSHHYVCHEVMVLPLHKAVHLLKENNLVNIEGDTCTWIEVEASKAWKTGAPREVDFHIFGFKKDINVAVAMINAIVSSVDSNGTLKKNGNRWICRNLKKGGKHSRRLIWQGTKVSCKFLRREGKHSARLLWQGVKVSSKCVWNRMKASCRKLK